MIDSVRHLQERLQSCEAVYEQTLTGLRSEACISDILRSVKASDARLDLNAALEELKYTRHRSRLSMIAADIEEGSSIGDVGRHWGFSRQLAQRYVKEARTESCTMSHEMAESDG